MSQIPRDKSLDSTLALLRDPYRFISKRCRRYQTDLFETRLLLEKTLCLTGPEAARLFYDPDRFMRRDAMPGAVKKTLLGQGGVQGLDGEAHRHRKRMLMSLMTPARLERLAKTTAEAWRTAARKWTKQGTVVLYDEACEVLARAVCAWSDVPLAESDVGRRARELTLLFDGAGATGLRHLGARLARKRADRWMEGVVEQIRSGHLQPPEGTAAHVIAWHRDLGGELLSAHVAAVDLLNLLRPTVAVAVYVTFVAHALHEHPECRRKLETDDGTYAALFVQEVRRFYPFFPAVAARVRRDFDWNGFRFPEGRLVLLDLYGTNHDARTWQAPEAFRPERFRQWDSSPFTFIPQGGGDHFVNHRCAGEWLTLELLKVAISFLTHAITYEVPAKNLQIDFARLPALPRSRLVMRNVRWRV